MAVAPEARKAMSGVRQSCGDGELLPQARNRKTRARTEALQLSHVSAGRSQERKGQRKMNIHIYGVFIKDRCIYVGRTSDLNRRSHTHVLRFRKLFNEEPVVRTLKRVSLESSAHAEWAMIRLYKDLGQADFNAEPGFVYSPPVFRPKSKRVIERSKKIIELHKQGHPRKEIAELLHIGATEISRVCRANNLWSLAGRKLGSGVGYGLKLTRAQFDEILRRDERNEPHGDIARLFGVSRQRVQQICEAAGHPPRQARRKEQTVREREARTAERQQLRLLKRLTPSASGLAFAKLWEEGKSLREIAATLGITRGATCVKLIRLRKRHPELFPYRRAEHLRFMGRNFRAERQQKEAA